MKRALDLLAAVFANPAAGAPLLEELRAGWRELAPDERAALTPLAKLAAERVKAAPKDDGDGYWASLESEAPPEEEWSSESAGYDDAPNGAALSAEDSDWRRERTRRGGLAPSSGGDAAPPASGLRASAGGGAAPPDLAPRPAGGGHAAAPSV
ncbi:hypothetical protein OM076_29395, partial [Solirubrobacter ginsenosidimutans]|nr:hypothetical protein [Solirubrobacter ginsenosidimutans]